MESVTDLYNVAQKLTDAGQSSNPFYQMASGFSNGLATEVSRPQQEIQQRRQAELQLEIELKKQQQQLDLAKRQTNLMNVSQRANSDQYNNNSIVGKATTNAQNPTYAETKVIKSTAMPANAMMSLVGGGYGDAAGNPVMGVPQTPTQDLGQTAKDMATTNVQSNPQEDRYSYSIKFNNGKVVPDIHDNQKEQQASDAKIASSGVDPNNPDGSRKSRTQILSEVAIQKNKELNPYVQMQMNEKRTQLNQKLYSKILERNNPAMASSRSTLGMAANGNLRAERALSAVQNNPVMTNQDLGNVIGDLAGIYQGGAPTDMGMKHQQYESIQQKIAGLKQFLTGRPQDAVPPEIKSKIIDTINNLKKINNTAIKNNFDSVEAGNKNLLSNYSDEWQAFRSQVEGEYANDGNNQSNGNNQDVRSQYNALRESGVSEEEAKKRFGL